MGTIIRTSGAGRGYRLTIGALAAAVVVVTLGAVDTPLFAFPGTATTEGLAGQAPHVWNDEEGNPLPVQTDAGLLELLRSATIVEQENIEIGVTAPFRVKLEEDGAAFHGIFRHVDTVYDRVRMEDGRVRMQLKDSCHFEVAAYELSRILGMDNVPPAVQRRIGTDNGTIQIWLYDAVMESQRSDRGLAAPDRIAWNRQVHTMYLFDALIGNDDRTAQNILIDGDYKLWLIDHTRAFYRFAEAPSLSKVIYVERGFWESLRALDKDGLASALGNYLSDIEIDQLLERRDKVVAYIDDLVATRGEGAVFYDRVPTDG